MRPLPQMEMSMYMGTSSTSQNRKNCSRSRETNTPMTPVSRISSQMKYSLTRSWICHDARIAANEMRAVRTTMGMLRPSTPRKYRTLRKGIHSYRSTNWGPVMAVSKRLAAARDNPRVPPAMARAIYLTCRSSLGSKAMTRAPARGRKTIIVRMPVNKSISWCYLVLSSFEMSCKSLAKCSEG